ncbi:M20 family metallopeptidase [Lachnospiraceae bacterium ZAX-1]
MKRLIIEYARENEPFAVALRRRIHQNPELSGVEFKTLRLICEQLTNFGIQFEEVEDGGILAYIGGGGNCKTVLLRADIDALPVVENESNLSCKRAVISQNPGVAHMCGHDAHTAILLTAAKILKENETELNGNRVILLFERGEEGTGNLVNILKVLTERKERVDAAHAIHVQPALPVGKLLALGGPFMAGGSVFHVTIKGCGGHGSRPDHANSPIDAFTAFNTALGAIRLRNISPYESVSYSIGTLHSGNKGNIIPNELTFAGSVRVYNEESFTEFVKAFKNALEHITAAYDCEYTLSGLSECWSPLINNYDAAEFAIETVKEYLGNDTLAVSEPLMGSESFGRIAALYPGIMLNLGVANEALGTGADWHSEYFDIDESALLNGVIETVAFAMEFLNSEVRF